MSVEMLSSPISEPAPAHARPAKGDEIDLGAIMAAIKRRRGTILGLAVACTAIGIGASYAVKPTYWAEAVISLNVRGAAVTESASVIPDLKVDNSIIRGEIDILTSRTAAGRVVDSLKLTPEPVSEEDGVIKASLQRMGRSIAESGLFDRVAALVGPSETIDGLRAALVRQDVQAQPVSSDPREQMINILLGNGDAHLKNWSILYPDGVNPVLSPAYDILFTKAYIPAEQHYALNMAQTKQWYEVSLEHFRRWVKRADLPESPILYNLKAALDKARALWPAALRDSPMHEAHKAVLLEHWRTLHSDFRIET